jgi:type IV secretory pathway TrbF-like protein
MPQNRWPEQGSPQASRAQVWRVCLGWLAGLVLCFLLASRLSPHGGQGIAGAYVLMQDRWLLAMAVGVALLSTLTAMTARSRFRPRGMGFSPAR